MARPGPKIQLTSPQRAVLERLSKSRTLPARLVERAAIILLAETGMSGTKIAAELGFDGQRARRWIRRWASLLKELASIEAAGATERELRKHIETVLTDVARPGAPEKFSPTQVAQLISLACEPPADSGIPITHWTPAELAKEAQKRGIVEAISPRHLDRLLKRGGSTPAQEPLLDDVPRQTGAP